MDGKRGAGPPCPRREPSARSGRRMARGAHDRGPVPREPFKRRARLCGFHSLSALKGGEWGLPRGSFQARPGLRRLRFTDPGAFVRPSAPGLGSRATFQPEPGCAARAPGNPGRPPRRAFVPLLSAPGAVVHSPFLPRGPPDPKLPIHSGSWLPGWQAVRMHRGPACVANQSQVPTRSATRGQGQGATTWIGEWGWRIQEGLGRDP